MGDFTGLIEVIKKASVDAVKADRPMAIMFGKVTSVQPLKINVEQKMTLESPQLILTRNVTDYTVKMTVDHVTNKSLNVSTSHDHAFSGTVDTYEGTTASGGEPPHAHEYSHSHAYSEKTSLNYLDVESLTHEHTYTGKKSFVVHNSLEIDDEVLLIQLQGGQKFLVLDRLG